MNLEGSNLRPDPYWVTLGWHYDWWHWPTIMSQVIFVFLFHKVFLLFSTLVTLWLTNVTDHNVTKVLINIGPIIISHIICPAPIIDFNHLSLEVELAMCILWKRLNESGLLNGPWNRPTSKYIFTLCVLLGRICNHVCHWLVTIWLGTKRMMNRDRSTHGYEWKWEWNTILRVPLNSMWVGNLIFYMDLRSLDKYMYDMWILLHQACRCTICRGTFIGNYFGVTNYCGSNETRKLSKSRIMTRY